MVLSFITIDSILYNCVSVNLSKWNQQKLKPNAATILTLSSKYGDKKAMDEMPKGFKIVVHESMCNVTMGLYFIHYYYYY